VEHLPERQRKMFEPFCLRPMGSPVIVVISLLAGIWIHLLLDSFTHKQGWLVEHLLVLQTVIFSVRIHDLTHDFKIFHLLWYLGSFAGIAWLYFAWEQWQNEIAGRAASRGQLGRAVLAGALMLPVALAHHLVHGPLGLCLTAGLSAIFVSVIVLKFGNKKS
jgi:hypothetical protein